MKTTKVINDELMNERVRKRKNFQTVKMKTKHSKTSVIANLWAPKSKLVLVGNEEEEEEDDEDEEREGKSICIDDENLIRMRRRSRIDERNTKRRRKRRRLKKEGGEIESNSSPYLNRNHSADLSCRQDINLRSSRRIRSRRGRRNAKQISSRTRSERKQFAFNSLLLIGLILIKFEGK